MSGRIEPAPEAGITTSGRAESAQVGRLLINGAWRDADNGARFAVHDPATGTSVGDVADGSLRDLRAAVVAASDAFPQWSRTPADQRAELLFAASRLVRERLETIARWMTVESGKPLAESRAEASSAVRYLQWAGEEAKRAYGRTIPASSPAKRLVVMRQPVGVVAALTPWNYPTSVLVRKIAPAIAAGCTVVLRPSSQTPFTAIALTEALNDAGVPAGVLNLVTSHRAAVAGRELATNRRVAKVTFTGSTEVGKLLLRQASTTVKRISLELGGHAPVIVFGDADLESAVDGVMASKFRNSGQTCVSANRLYVERSVYPRVVDAVAERFSALRVGPGLEEGSQVGPLINAAALARVQFQVDDARARGARIVVGGRRRSGGPYDAGHYFDPTLLTDVPRGARMLRDESFGPLLPVIPFDTEAQVLAAANSTRYGLAAYVYTRDLGRAFRMVEGLDNGLIGCNEVTPTTAQLPSGGFKESGLGRENGREGLDDYLETKSVSFTI